MAQQRCLNSCQNLISWIYPRQQDPPLSVSLLKVCVRGTAAKSLSIAEASPNTCRPLRRQLMSIWGPTFGTNCLFLMTVRILCLTRISLLIVKFHATNIPLWRLQTIAIMNQRVTHTVRSVLGGSVTHPVDPAAQDCRHTLWQDRQVRVMSSSMTRLQSKLALVGTAVLPVLADLPRRHLQ